MKAKVRGFLTQELSERAWEAQCDHVTKLPPVDCGVYRFYPGGGEGRPIYFVAMVGDSVDEIEWVMSDGIDVDPEDSPMLQTMIHSLTLRHRKAAVTTPDGQITKHPVGQPVDRGGNDLTGKPTPAGMEARISELHLEFVQSIRAVATAAIVRGVEVEGLGEALRRMTRSINEILDDL